MACHAVHAAYQIAFEVHLQQFGREGEIDVAAFEIDGNALHVERTFVRPSGFRAAGYADGDRFSSGWRLTGRPSAAAERSAKGSRRLRFIGSFLR